jgi:hypothetical protein
VNSQLVISAASARRAESGATSESAQLAHVKKGLNVPAPQWWKHLRRWKRAFWNKERKAAQRLIWKEL